MVDLYNHFKDFKSFEATFFDKNHELHKLSFTVKSIDGKRIVLSANNQKSKNVFAHPRAELKLIIYSDSGVYTGSSKVIHVSKGLFSTEYIITAPANSKHSQRRQFYRAEISIPFKLKCLKDKQSLESFIIEAKTKNICAKGLSYYSDSIVPDHESCELELFFKERKIRTSAVHVYTTQVQFGNRSKYIHAFSFDTINNKDMEFITKKCFLHQLHLIKRNKRL